MGIPTSDQLFTANHAGVDNPDDPSLFTAAELVAGSFGSAAVSASTSAAVSTVNAAAPDSTSISQARSQAVSAASVGSVADSKAVSGSFVTSTADSKALSVSGSTSIADSKAVSVATATPTVTAIVYSANISIADSKATSIAIGVPKANRSVTNVGTYLGNAAVFNVRDYGVGLLSGADWTTPILNAAADAEVAGGILDFPVPWVYGISSQVAITSIYAVHLRSNMGPFSSTGGAASYFKPLNNITGSMFKYVAPGGVRGSGGGGTVRGLAFQDDSNLNDVTPHNRRTYTMTAALELYDFGLSRVENCHFQYLKGSAIRTDFAVMSSVSGCTVRYCGDTGKPALNISSTDGTYYTQSFGIIDCRLEVNYDAEYIKLDSRAQQVKISKCGFEADTSDAFSSQNFINDVGGNATISTNHFNRNNALAVSIGSNTSLTGNLFNGIAAVAGCLSMTGTAGIATGNTFFSCLNEIAVNVGGTNNTFGPNTMNISGGITVTGNGAAVDNNNIWSPNKSSGYVIDLTAGTDATASGNKIRFASLSTTTGGIQLGAAPQTAHNNQIRNALVGINVNTTTAIVTNNWLANCSTPMTGVANFVRSSTVARNSGFVTEAKGSTAIANGTTTIAVNHGLSYTPQLQDVTITPSNNYGSANHVWLNAISSSQLTFNSNVDPGATTATFGWSVKPW